MSDELKKELEKDTYVITNINDTVYGKRTTGQRLADAVAKFDMKYENFDYVAPLYVPTDSELVQTLMQTYQDLTGDTESKPAISGGATFARTMHNCVAFGGMLPTTPDFMHQANENWSKADMRKAMEIFAEAIYRLCV
ncbi:M20/M25/M40 family metallo-hydrolase [Companilactobacillus halodurans]